MRVKCAKLPIGGNAVFMWEETIGKKPAGPDGEEKPIKKKVFKVLSENDQFDVADEDGHELLAKYKGLLQVVHYGEGEVKKAMAAAPKNAAVKEAEVK